VEIGGDLWKLGHAIESGPRSSSVKRSARESIVEEARGNSRGKRFPRSRKSGSGGRDAGLRGFLSFCIPLHFHSAHAPRGERSRDRRGTRFANPWKHVDQASIHHALHASPSPDLLKDLAGRTAVSPRPTAPQIDPRQRGSVPLQRLSRWGGPKGLDA
jgi:hypothetical protein